MFKFNKKKKGMPQGNVANPVDAVAHV